MLANTQSEQEKLAPVAALFASTIAGPGVPVTRSLSACTSPVIFVGMPFSRSPLVLEPRPPSMEQSSNRMLMELPSVQFAPAPHSPAGEMTAPH